MTIRSANHRLGLDRGHPGSTIDRGCVPIPLGQPIVPKSINAFGCRASNHCSRRTHESPSPHRPLRRLRSSSLCCHSHPSFQLTPTSAHTTCTGLPERQTDRTMRPIRPTRRRAMAAASISLSMLLLLLVVLPPSSIAGGGFKSSASSPPRLVERWWDASGSKGSTQQQQGGRAVAKQPPAPAFQAVKRCVFQLNNGTRLALAGALAGGFSNRKCAPLQLSYESIRALIEHESENPQWCSTRSTWPRRCGRPARPPPPPRSPRRRGAY
jgi:hypothetical protein